MNLETPILVAGLIACSATLVAAFRYLTHLTIRTGSRGGQPGATRH
jgi:hypothetical protein